MIKKFFFRDSMSFGVIIGIIIPSVAYFIIYNINAYALKYYHKELILTPGTMQLVALCANIILFRLYMLKWDKEQSGKGMLLATFALAFVYIFLHRNLIL